MDEFPPKVLWAWRSMAVTTKTIKPIVGSTTLLLSQSITELCVVHL